MLAQVVHTAFVEGKDLRVEVKKRLMNYQNTNHPATGRSLVEMFPLRQIKTKILAIIKTKDPQLEAAQEKDEEGKRKRKEEFDKKKGGKEKEIEIGDKVLIEQKKSSRRSLYDPEAYKVIGVE